jgi:ATP-binding cassette subfamily C (CFTR/MRP) protein 1
MAAIAYLRAFSRSYMSALPGLVAVGSFVVYVLAISDASISASTLFAALVAFDQLRFPLLFYPMSLAQLSQAKVSAARVETFLSMKEVGKDTVTSSGDGDKAGGQYTRNEDAHEGKIEVKDVTVFWSDPKIPITKKDDGTSSDAGGSTSERSLGSKKSDDTKTANEDYSDNIMSQPLIFPKPVLQNVSLTVRPGELCAVVGRVASGKSTICSAVLNETILESGSISLSGKVAYAAQSPWILNASLRDNILFGLPMDKEKYNHVMEACQMKYDLELLDQGDLTEIGERGINLSGGQKARVSVARAAYSNADTIVLDDPLSALDPEVGKKLFDECIVKLMKGKTRLLVTNQVQFLQFCDNIVALGQKTVLEQGTFAELNAKEGGEVQRILADLEKSKQSNNSSSVTKKTKDKSASKSKTDAAAATPTAAIVAPKENKGLVTKEERNIGAVSLTVYKKYFVAGGGLLKFFLVYGAFLLSAANQLASVSWVSFWTSDADYDNFSQAFYLGMYALIAGKLVRPSSCWFGCAIRQTPHTKASTFSRFFLQ